MNTKVLIPTDQNLKIAAELIKRGEIIGLPTETVYGLAADAFNEKAIKKIFEAKGRPQDNPLIVHISSTEMINDIVEEIPDVAYKLADEFWPGPLTIIFKKKDSLPMSVTAGLDTVAVRFPNHKTALEIIRLAGVPLAAPSANLSGSPSPTEAQHVYNDLQGRIPVIVDGGSCEYGLESTVILINSNEEITLLRPGAVTVEMLKSVVNNVKIDKGVLNVIEENEKALSPGMKHKHYSPNAKIVIVESNFADFKKFIDLHINEDIGAMVFEGEDKCLSVPSVCYGKEDEPLAQAKLLFSALRAVDDMGVKTIYARICSKNGIGLAINNRMLRAAGFEVIKL